MSDDLPEEFDLVVVGTGLSESIVAAAASRIGKTVLHIDASEYYGGYWSSFNFENLMNYLSNNDKGDSYKLMNAEQEWFNFTEEIPEINGWNKDKIIKENRSFNIDLIPKIVFSCGKLVELLISSNICRYTEFRAVDKILTLQDGKLTIVPCSRADVFTSKNVSVIEKRLLMKFLNSCMEFSDEKNDFEGFNPDGLFLDLLHQQKLPKNLVHFILYAICMGDNKTSFRDGIENVKKFLSSIGRYGNTPFLFPMYGCGEIPQCFCRLCAVFGGIYCLNRPLSEIEKDAENNKVTFKVGEQKISTKFLVGGLVKNNGEELSRGIFLTTRPIGGDSVNSDTDGGGVVFMKIPPIEGINSTGAFLIQLAHFSGTVPKGLYLTHITTIKIKESAKSDLEPFVDLLFKKDFNPESDGSESELKPTILYSLYFNIPYNSNYNVDSQEGPIFNCCGPYFEPDYDSTLEQSEMLFKKIFPDEEYLPKAPNPEEIIFGDDDGKNNLGNINLGVLTDILPQEEEPIETGEIAEESTAECATECIADDN